MILQRLVGLALLAGGVMLAAFGARAPSLVDADVNDTFIGRFTEVPTWYIIGGSRWACSGCSCALYVRGDS